jgi:hypothetical protein
MRILMLTSIAVACLALTNGSAVAETILLNCTLSCADEAMGDCPANSDRDITLRIDTDKQVVFMADSKYPATFTQSFIKWRSWEGSYSLNRATLKLGYVTFNSPDGKDFNLNAPLYSGPCHKGANQI